MITVTDKAAEALKKLLADEASSTGNTSIGLRLGVDQGGCAGLQYAMRFASAEAGDSIFAGDEGVRVYIAGDSIDYLSGSQIDYIDSLNDSGFKINNPNASRSCGCGTSFEPTDGSAEPTDPEAFDAGEDCTTS